MEDAPTGVVRREIGERTMRARITAIAIFTLVGSSIAGAQETARVPVGPESKLWIEGTSNLHGWKCTAEKLDAAIELDALAATQANTFSFGSLQKKPAKYSLEEAFAEVKLKDVSTYYDFISVRAGIQPFVSDFRGLVFSEQQLGARVFGNAANRFEI
jgi:hypothetical protein